MQQDLLTKWYKLSGYNLCIQYSPGLAGELGGYLNIAPAEAGKSHLNLDLRSIDPGQLDQYLPLPAQAEQIPDFTLLLNRPVTVRSFRGDNEQWNDYQGYARSYVSSTDASARVVILAGHDILPLYTDMLFTYNLVNQLMGCYDHFAVHAACVDHQGAGIMISGNSGRGKSTAVFALLQRGFKILSDERVLISKLNERYWGCSVSDIIKVREAARERFFPDLPMEQAYGSIEDEHYFRCSAITADSWRSHTEIKYFLVINRSDTRYSSLTPINPTRAVGEFFPVTMKAWENREAAAKKFNFLMDFLSALPCYQLDFGTDMTQFADIIRELAEGRTAQ
jgi:hypothetical protein